MKQLHMHVGTTKIYLQQTLHAQGLFLNNVEGVDYHQQVHLIS